MDEISRVEIVAIGDIVQDSLLVPTTNTDTTVEFKNNQLRLHPRETGKRSIEYIQRRADIMTLVSEGLSYREIAKELGVTLQTVFNHVSQALRDYDEVTSEATVTFRSRAVVQLEKLIEQAMDDAVTVSGGGGDLSPAQAAKIRDMAGNRAVKLLALHSKILGYQQPERSLVEHKVAHAVVVKMDVDEL